METWIRAELRRWRSWRPWAVLVALSGPVYVVAELSVVLGFALGLPAPDDHFKRLLSCLWVFAAIISWVTGFTAARYSRRFAMLAIPPLVVLALCQFCFATLRLAGYREAADVALAAAGFLVLFLLPGFLGWRRGWTAGRLSLRTVVAITASFAATLIWAWTGVCAEWAGLALMLLCAWPVFHAVAVSCRPSTARN